MMKKSILIAAGLVLMAACAKHSEVSVSELQRHFVDPPRESRPMVWWHWMDGNITKDGIRKDLEWMNRAGIRGFHLFDAALATPRVVDRRLVYMTPEWKDAFRYALDKADSLDMEVGIASSPGWSHTGGPWVRPEDGMKKLVWREMDVEGGQLFEGKLPEGYDNAGSFQNVGGLAYLGVENNAERLYEDIAVVAIKTPEEEEVLHPSSFTVSGGKGGIETLTDKDLSTGLRVLPKDGVCRIEYRFDHPVTVRSLVVADEGGRGEMIFKADGVTVCELPLSAISEQTVSFAPVTASRFSLEMQIIPPSVVLSLLGIKIADALTLNEFRISGVTLVNQAEAKAGYLALQDLQAHPTPDDGAAYAPQAIDLTEFFKDGILRWNVPEGRWKIYRFGWSLTGKKNAPAPAEATGLEVDKLDPDAWERYVNGYLDMYKDAAGGSLEKIHYLLTDSWEAGNENWTPRMREEFTVRRGYDPLPWFPAIAGVVVDSVSATEKFLLDWRLTLEELVAENFDRLTDLVKARGLQGRYSESHEGARAFLADGMDVKRTATIPMCAIWTPGTVVGSPLVTAIADIRESASVSHIYGQQYVAAESMTAVGLFGQAYSYYPGNLKPVTDLEFASGVNRIIIHESAHQPLDEKYPGVGLSITGQWFNRHETWAEQARPWTDYLARTSYLLSQGRNVADILVFYGDDTNITARYGHGELEKLPKGYNYDFVNPYALLNAISFKNGRFTAPSGNSWQVLALDADIVSDKVQAQIDAWRAQGARICTLAELSMDGIPADVVSTRDINYVHRSVADGQYYWVSNPSDDFATIDLSFRAKGRHVSIWDPETGEISPCEFVIADGRTLVTWNAQPNDAKFFVFSGKELASSHSELACHSERSEESLLSGPWDISFQEGRGAPPEAVFDTLHSFSEDQDPGIRYFSGTASYRKDFTIEGPVERTFLSLGDVQNIAEVIVNGKSVCTLWKVPYDVDITDHLKEGANTLEIRVTNLWPNRLIGDAALPEAERLTYIGFPFYKATDPLRPAGLIGPVKLVFH